MAVLQLMRYSWKTTVLQGHWFGYRLGPFYLESHHAKFQLNPLRNGLDIGFYCLKILQRCMEDCSAAGSLFWL